MNEFQKVTVIAVSYFAEDSPSEGVPYLIYDITNNKTIGNFCDDKNEDILDYPNFYHRDKDDNGNELPHELEPYRLLSWINHKTITPHKYDNEYKRTEGYYCKYDAILHNNEYYLGKPIYE